MEGEDEESSDDIRSFTSAHMEEGIGNRIRLRHEYTLAFILAAIVLSSVGYATNSVSYLGENSPLRAAGMDKGDSFISYAGKRLYDPLDITLCCAEDGSPKDIIYEMPIQKGYPHHHPSQTQTIWRLLYCCCGKWCWHQ